MKQVATLTWDRSQVAEALGLNNDALNYWTNDGRSLNSLVQFKLITELNAKTRPVTGGTRMFILENEREFLVRCLTKHSGVSFMPSYMKGNGRSYKPNAFRDWVGDFDGFLVPNITDWPVVDVYRLSNKEILQIFDYGKFKPELTFHQFLYLIDHPHITKSHPQPYLYLTNHAKAS